MKIAVSNPLSVVGRNYRNLFGKENVLNDSWNEFITEDEICEIVSLKELINNKGTPSNFSICRPPGSRIHGKNRPEKQKYSQF